MLIVSDKGVLNPQIVEFLNDENSKNLRIEMIKTIDELYEDDSMESQIIKDFITEFFYQYQKEMWT